MLGPKGRPGPDDPGQSLLDLTAASAETFHSHYFETVRLTVVVCVLPPPVPLMVMVEVPVLANPLTVTFMVDVPEPGMGMAVGAKLSVTPVGWPDADKAI